MGRQYNFNISEKGTLGKKPHFFHIFSHYLDILFDSLLKHAIIWFTLNFIFKNGAVVFLGKVFRHVLLLYAALDQFLVKICPLENIFKSKWISINGACNNFCSLFTYRNRWILLQQSSRKILLQVFSAKTSFKEASRSPFHSTRSLDNR